MNAHYERNAKDPNKVNKLFRKTTYFIKEKFKGKILCACIRPVK